jgi:hypothetical protein
VGNVGAAFEVVFKVDEGFDGAGAVETAFAVVAADTGFVVVVHDEFKVVGGEAGLELGKDDG